MLLHYMEAEVFGLTSVTAAAIYPEGVDFYTAIEVYCWVDGKI